nr:hypothetical protein [Tanacetum cinerariifolium]
MSTTTLQSSMAHLVCATSRVKSIQPIPRPQSVSRSSKDVSNDVLSVHVGNLNAYDWLKCVAHDPRDEIDGYEAVWIEGTRLKELDAPEALDPSSAGYKKESSSHTQETSF